MGLYGSPDLTPSEKAPDSYSYGYGKQAYPTYYPLKPKRHWGMFFIGFISGIIVVFMALGFTNTYSKTAAQKVPMQTYSAPAQIVRDGSEDYLQGWTKMVILKSLLYPDSAKFSDNSSDWSFDRESNVCIISSIVTAKGQSKKTGTANFIVKMAYDDLQAKVTYISIGGHVSYDAESQKQKK